MGDIDWDICAILMDPDRIIDRVNKPQYLGLKVLVEYFEDSLREWRKW